MRFDSRFNEGNNLNEVRLHISDLSVLQKIREAILKNVGKGICGFEMKALLAGFNHGQAWAFISCCQSLGRVKNAFVQGGYDRNDYDPFLVIVFE